MNKFPIDSQTALTGNYGPDIAKKINNAISEIKTEIENKTGRKNVKIKIKDCKVENDKLKNKLTIEFCEE